MKPGASAHAILFLFLVGGKCASAFFFGTLKPPIMPIITNHLTRMRLEDYLLTHRRRGDCLITCASKKGGGAMARRKKRKASSSPRSSSSTGFGGGKVSVLDESKGRIYSLPALYDLAFGYRNYEEEVKFLLHAHHAHGGGGRKGGPKRVLELAAGPARHSITSLRIEGTTVEAATAVDLSEDMVKYGNENADLELGDTGGVRDAFTYIQGDMRTFCTDEDATDSDEKFDTAWILLGSMAHLITNDDVISCFQSTAKALEAGGTLIVELSHPRETFTMVECTRNGWQVPLEDEEGQEYGELKIIWGDDDDPFDPIRQVRDFTVAMELTGVEKDGCDGLQKSVKEVVPMRLFTAQEVDALARCSGFEVTAMYGALNEDVAIDDDDEAFRLVCVLRKK